MKKKDMLRDADHSGGPATTEELDTFGNETEVGAPIDPPVEGMLSEPDAPNYRASGLDGEGQTVRDHPAFVGDEETPEAVTVRETAAGLAMAKVNMDEAIRLHNEAKDAHAVALKGPGPELGVHLVVDGGTVNCPDNWVNEKPYRMLYQGRNVEHTQTLDNGVWVYEHKR